MNSFVYDNPSTMHRELWQDGKVESSISADGLAQITPQGDHSLDFRLNVGRWKSGSVEKCGLNVRNWASA